MPLLHGRCNLCGWPLFRLPAPATGRCLRCLSTPIHRGVGRVIESLALPPESRVYELSSKGALVRYLRKKFHKVYLSEFFDSVPPGEFCGAVQCQDVQSLLIPGDSFVLVTSTEVFEHVPDDRRGFSEIARVLQSGGWFVFTVPLLAAEKTLERVTVAADGSFTYLTAPEYHGDRLRGRDRVLAFRTYGRDICQRLAAAGLTAVIEVVDDAAIAVTGQQVIIARKGDS